MIKISEKILLRKLRPSDATSISEHANNINIWKNLTDVFPHPYSLQNAVDFISEHSSIEPPRAFAIEFNNSVIGIISLSVDEKNVEICGDIGYWIGEEFWNRGIATKAIKGIINYGFSNYKNINCFSAYVYTSNIASIKALKKAGFKHEKTYKNSIPKAGEKKDVHFFIIYRTDF